MCMFQVKLKTLPNVAYALEAGFSLLAISTNFIPTWHFNTKCLAFSNKFARGINKY